jgi:hypothetical protein
MAKRTSGPNKSDAIREYLKSNPDAPAKDVITNLQGKGLKVQSSLVYFIKGKMKAGKQRRAKVVSAARVASSNGRAIGSGDAISLIREVKALAEKAGGYENLKGLVEALAE